MSRQQKKKLLLKDALQKNGLSAIQTAVPAVALMSGSAAAATFVTLGFSAIEIYKSNYSKTVISQLPKPLNKKDSDTYTKALTRQNPILYFNPRYIAKHLTQSVNQPTWGPTGVLQEFSRLGASYAALKFGKKLEEKTEIPPFYGTAALAGLLHARLDYTGGNPLPLIAMHALRVGFSLSSGLKEKSNLDNASDVTDNNYLKDALQGLGMDTELTDSLKEVLESANKETAEMLTKLKSQFPTETQENFEATSSIVQGALQAKFFADIISGILTGISLPQAVAQAVKPATYLNGLLPKVLSTSCSIVAIQAFENIPDHVQALLIKKFDNISSQLEKKQEKACKENIYSHHLSGVRPSKLPVYKFKKT